MLSRAVCEQGVCCSTSCAGTCKSCALPNARGTCTNVPTGDTDPHGACTNVGPASCKTDGFCDGSGACRLYEAPAPRCCAAPSCSSTPTPTLTSGGGLRRPRHLPGGVADRLRPLCLQRLHRLQGGLHRRRRLPARETSATLSPAAAATRPASAKPAPARTMPTNNTCVDGVCCSTTSCPLCKACNIAGSAGNCANVAINSPEPHALCAPTPPCGNTGSCNGLGACQQAGTTVSCGTAACVGSTFTPLSHCNGSGACAAPTASTCSPYVCGTGACKTACTADADCIAPFTCQGSGATRSCAQTQRTDLHPSRPMHQRRLHERSLLR